MIDKYRLENMRRESGEKGELARWAIQLQTDLDSERRKAGNSPVTPDGWISVSERMPEAHEPIYIFHPDYGVDEGVWYDNQEDTFLWDSDCSRCRAIETVSHWMPMPALPAAPQQEVKSALEHGMQRYAGAMQKLSEGDK